MKKFIMLIIVLALLIVTFGCTQEVKEPIDVPVKEPVVEPVENNDEKLVIKPIDKVALDDLTMLDEFDMDFDNDGIEEKIGMYTAAGKDANGEIAWDDGQRWLFLVQDTDKDYVLVDEYVQLGSIDFNVYTIEDDFYIATHSARTASLRLNLYHYDRENDSFEMTTPFNTKGNVNMIKSSYGY